MTGKPRCFALQYFATHCLYQTDFVTLLKNTVPNTLALRCISVDYTHFCEGCESKKCKNVGCARTRTRERGGKDENLGHSKWFSEVRFILLQATNKNIGRFPKNVGLFPKNVGHFSAHLPRFFFTLQCATKSTLVYHPLHNEYFRLIVLGFVHLFPYVNTKRKCNGEMWVKNDGATTVHPETTKLGRLQSEKRWR